MNKKFLLIVMGVFLINLVFATGMSDPFGDYDSDGVLNINDNCYYVYNPFQIDGDNDGYGNCCDPSYILNKNPNTDIWCDEPNQNFCGDGTINQIQEQCDDGNVINNDGCSFVCLIEVPTNPFCGNNILETGETCDDGNIASGDGCSNLCQIEGVIPPVNNTNQTKTTASYRNHFVQFCESNWECSGWSECNNEIMTRKCYDTNNCGLNYNKPLEEAGCELEKALIEPEKGANYLFIFLGISFALLIVLIIMLSLI